MSDSDEGSFPAGPPRKAAEERVSSPDRFLFLVLALLLSVAAFTALRTHGSARRTVSANATRLVRSG